MTATLNDWAFTILDGSTPVDLPASSPGDLLVIYFKEVIAPIAPFNGYTRISGAGGNRAIAHVMNGTEGPTLDTGAYDPATGGGGTSAIATTWTPDDCLVNIFAGLLKEDRTNNPREVSGSTSFGGDPHIVLFGTGTGSFGGTPAFTPIDANGEIAFADGGDQPAAFSYDYTFSSATELFVVDIFADPVASSCSVFGDTSVSFVGDTVHFEVDISIPGYFGTIGGSVEFFIDGVSQGTVSVTPGSFSAVAETDLTFLWEGTDVVRAVYSGYDPCIPGCECTVNQFVSTRSGDYWGILASDA
jgi:hypothetical protein